jgi:hypothetical protein
VNEPVPPATRATSARRQDVEKGLQWLSGVGENDPGLFVVSNHGDQSGICLWDRQKETPMIFDPNGLAGSILIIGGPFSVALFNVFRLIRYCRLDEIQRVGQGDS